MGLSFLIGRLLAGYLTGPSAAHYANVPTDQIALARILRPGDVLLIDGRQRISSAIKYLTQSTWSHAALCVVAEDPSSEIRTELVEADAVEGVRRIPLTAFSGLHTRICRPVGLSPQEIDSVIGFALYHVGDGYDLANVIDLARYLFPTPPVPSSWRRRMLALGSGEPSKAICSTLIAQAFQSIRYPILPEITRSLSSDPACERCIREVLHIRRYSLYTPRDFDVSPFFQIIKPSIVEAFDHRQLSWGNRLPAEAEPGGAS